MGERMQWWLNRATESVAMAFAAACAQHGIAVTWSATAQVGADGVTRYAGPWVDGSVMPVEVWELANQDLAVDIVTWVESQAKRGVTSLTVAADTPRVAISTSYPPRAVWLLYAAGAGGVPYREPVVDAGESGAGVRLTGVPQDEAIDPKKCTPVDFALGEAMPDPAEACSECGEAGCALDYGFDGEAIKQCSGTCHDKRAAKRMAVRAMVHATPTELAQRGISPWRNTLSDWRKLIEDHTPAHSTIGEVVGRLARDFGYNEQPTTKALARALFETDPDVINFVNCRSENDVSEKRAGIMQRCWDRGHAGESPEWKWYVRAADRAKAMAGKMGGER